MCHTVPCTHDVTHIGGEGEVRDGPEDGVRRDVDLVHGVQQIEALVSLVVAGRGLLDALEVPDSDPAVTADGDELPLRHDELLDGALVAGGEVSPPDLHLHAPLLPQQQVAPLTARHHLPVPQLDEGLDVGDRLVVEHPPGEVHLAAAAGPRDPPEVDVSVTTGGDQGGVRLTEGHVVDIEIFPLAGAQQCSLLPPPD